MNRECECVDTVANEREKTEWAKFEVRGQPKFFKFKMHQIWNTKLNELKTQKINYDEHVSMPTSGVRQYSDSIHVVI